jgi:hypothetical protein
LGFIHGAAYFFIQGSAGKPDKDLAFLCAELCNGTVAVCHGGFSIKGDDGIATGIILTKK